MKLSIVMPALNEAQNLPYVVNLFYGELHKNGIEHELLVIDDNSTDNTTEVLEQLQKTVPTLRAIFNPPPGNGYGFAVRKGLENTSGGCIAIVMADLSDSPADLVNYYNTFIEQKVDCVFGSRFIKGGKVTDYPKEKLYLNRFVNNTIAVLFNFRYNDVTNGFKLFSKSTIEGLKPYKSSHFNFCLELPLRAIVRGYSYSVVPNSWQNRKYGTSHLKISEMFNRYLYIAVDCFIEKYFIRKNRKKI